jgi:hypothetical protein
MVNDSTLSMKSFSYRLLYCINGFADGSLSVSSRSETAHLKWSMAGDVLEVLISAE